MIPRVTKGRSAYGALRYDHGPGRREEHDNARTVAGNVLGGWRDKATVIDGQAQHRRDVERPIWRSSLRAAPEDRALSDEEWGQIAKTYAERMGFKDCPWTATRHGDDHVHVTVSRVDWEGRLVSDRWDYARAQTVCREIETRHQLVNASERYQRGRPEVSHGEREHAERRGVVPEREQLRDRVAEAVALANGSLESYEQHLGGRGIVYRRNEAATGRVSGYSYGLAGHLDPAGEQVWFKGSQLGRDFRWSVTQERLNERQVERPVSRLGRAAQGEQSAARDPQDRPESALARLLRERRERERRDQERER